MAIGRRSSVPLGCGDEEPMPELTLPDWLVEAATAATADDSPPRLFLLWKREWGTVSGRWTVDGGVPQMGQNRWTADSRQ